MCEFPTDFIRTLAQFRSLTDFFFQYLLELVEFHTNSLLVN